MTKIEWAEESLNIVTGCTKVSAGCENCYAERMAKRLRAMGRPEYQLATDMDGWTGEIGFVEERLRVPMEWKKTRRVFVNSMSDTFHGKVHDLNVYRMFDMVVNNPEHIFIFVTKRAHRARRTLNYYCDTFHEGNPIPNLWLLVSVENQKTADERITHLLGANAVVRGLSMEPLLGDVNIARYYYNIGDDGWVIVGGESGPGARPMHPDWARSIRDQCVNHGIPFFFKQWGGANKKKAGRVLDGRTWDEYPVGRFAQEPEG